jgi:hypothetical protein
MNRTYLLILFLYFFIIFFFNLVLAKKRRSLEDYFLASRDLSAFWVGLALSGRGNASYPGPVAGSEDPKAQNLQPAGSHRGALWEAGAASVFSFDPLVPDRSRCIADGGHRQFLKDVSRRILFDKLGFGNGFCPLLFSPGGIQGCRPDQFSEVLPSCHRDPCFVSVLGRQVFLDRYFTLGFRGREKPLF